VLDGTTFEGEVRRVVEVRAAELVAFQSESVAREYVDMIERVWAGERKVTDRTEFSEAVARGLFKFTAYKDEYEVARLLVDPAFLDDVRSQVPTGENLTFKLHPPILRAMGRKKKIGLGPKSHVALKALAYGKRLRGTKLDPFGYAHVRRVERVLLSQYRNMVSDLADGLDFIGYDKAVEIAQLPDVVRGYEDIKLANVEAYSARLVELGMEKYVPTVPNGRSE
jgi:indolepyruvate ferredoxin oxidoreductase